MGTSGSSGAQSVIVAANDLAKSLLNQNKYDQELHLACPRRVRRAIRPGKERHGDSPKVDKSKTLAGVKTRALLDLCRAEALLHLNHFEPFFICPAPRAHGGDDGNIRFSEQACRREGTSWFHHRSCLVQVDFL